MAEPRNPNIFEPPTAEQLELHLAQHPVVQTTPWQSRVPVVVLIVLLVLMLLTGNPIFAILPLLCMLGMMAYFSSRARSAIELQQRVTRVWEQAMIRRYREAMGQAWELLPQCTNRPELHGRLVTVIAHILGQLGRDDAAQVAYQYLLDRLPTDHPLSLRLRLQGAVAALGADRLADADDTLRKLRGRAEQSDDETLIASYRLARLLQDVRTGHYADAIEHADQTAKALIPLGIEAGYGHGLLALCYHQLAERTPVDENEQRLRLAELARVWWDRATLLIPVPALLFRHPDLKPMPTAIQHLGHANDDELTHKPTDPPEPA